MPTTLADSRKLRIHLSQRQHEIIFLLGLGMSQYTIAEVLKIQRTSISRTILSVLCPKFGVAGKTDLLLLETRKVGIHQYIPVSLCKPLLIIFSSFAHMLS